VDPLWLLLPSGQRRSGEWIDDTLARRVAERGMEAKWPLAANFPRQRVEVIRAADPDASDLHAEVNDLFYKRGWTDGLPIMPPTLGKVEAAVRASGRSPRDALGEMEPLGGIATVEKIAANAVMAGAAPAHMPVILAAVDAILDPAFNLRGIQTTDENAAPLLIVNGPAASALDINDSYGALGPGWRANACIGRAIRLVMNNIGGGWPAVVSFAGLGYPGRYTLCFAEKATANPWEPAGRDHDQRHRRAGGAGQRHGLGGVFVHHAVRGQGRGGHRAIRCGEAAQGRLDQGGRESLALGTRAHAGGGLAAFAALHRQRGASRLAGLGAHRGQGRFDPGAARSRRHHAGGCRRRHPDSAMRLFPELGLSAMLRHTGNCLDGRSGFGGLTAWCGGGAEISTCW
jgi:hypothetical protein